MADEAGEPESEAGEEQVPEPEPERLHGALVTGEQSNRILFPAVDELVELCRVLKSEGYVMCIDLTVVDHLRSPVPNLPTAVEPGRFELVVLLINHGERSRVRLRVQLDGDEPVAPTLFDVWPGTEAMEREAFDMFGVTFDGHPDLTRVLMPENWIGHPLRKDYAVGRIPVQFKGAPSR